MVPSSGRPRGANDRRSAGVCKTVTWYQKTPQMAFHGEASKVMSKGKTILVGGATGQQGGAVVRHLLKGGWTVRALTRDPEKDASKALADLGAEVVAGDMDQPATLPPVVEGAYGVFSVQNTWVVGAEREIAEGKALADAARAAGVQHFVYTSVGGAERQTGLPHFDSKWVLEEYLRGLDLPYTILRPVFFMDNFLGMKQQIVAGTLAMGLRPDIRLQMVSVDDIGAFATLAFAHPDKWLGTATELAGDELTMPSVARRFTALDDQPVEYVEVPYEETAKGSPEYAAMYQWFNDYGYEADLAWLREQYPKLKSFDDWLEEYWVK